MYKLLLILLILVSGCSKPDFVHEREKDKKQEEKQKQEENPAPWYYFL